VRHFNVAFAAAIPSGSNPNPLPFAIIDGLTIDTKPSYAKYKGQYVHAKVVALKEAETTFKIDTIDIFAGALAQMYGATPAAGSMIPVVGEIKVSLTGASYTVANVGTGTQNYFVQNLTDGIWMTRVASGSEATGKYSVNEATGVYTFAAGDNGKNLSFTYAYGSASVGKTTTIANAVGSIVTGVQLVGFAQSTNGKPAGVKLLNAYLEGLTLDFKAGDFTKQGVSGFCAEDATTGNVMSLWTGE
jgi:uncharacterized protein YxeA